MTNSTLGSIVRANVATVQTRLNGSPATSAEWQTIARQLRTAADKARQIARFAERMEAAPTHQIDYWLAERQPLDTSR